ncbi:MAG TPA: hypothetical protein VEN78_19495 [Bradyrhizobium sp.]|nr:hypothetical protein [Bradyrhizobium sp.]
MRADIVVDVRLLLPVPFIRDPAYGLGILSKTVFDIIRSYR